MEVVTLKSLKIPKAYRGGSYTPILDSLKHFGCKVTKRTFKTHE